MLKILLDNDFNHRILRGLRRRLPELDSLAASEIGLRTAHDIGLLRWAAANKRRLITHDRATMPDHFALSRGEVVNGILIVPQSMAIGVALDEIELFVLCEEHGDWVNRLQIL